MQDTGPLWVVHQLPWQSWVMAAICYSIMLWIIFHKLMPVWLRRLRAYIKERFNA